MKYILKLAILFFPFNVFSQWENIPIFDYGVCASLHGNKKIITAIFNPGNNIFLANNNTPEINWNNITYNINSIPTKDNSQSQQKIRVLNDSTIFVLRRGNLNYLNLKNKNWKNYSKILPYNFEFKNDSLFFISIEPKQINGDEKINLQYFDKDQDSLTLLDTLIINNWTNKNFNSFLKLGENLFFYTYKNNLNIFSNNFYLIDEKNKFKELPYTGLPNNFYFKNISFLNEKIYAFTLNIVNQIALFELYCFQNNVWLKVNLPAPNDNLLYFTSSNNLLFCFYQSTYYVSKDEGENWEMKVYSTPYKNSISNDANKTQLSYFNNNKLIFPSGIGTFSTNLDGGNYSNENKGICILSHNSLGIVGNEMVSLVRFNNTYIKKPTNKLWKIDSSLNFLPGLDDITLSIGKELIVQNLGFPVFTKIKKDTNGFVDYFLPDSNKRIDFNGKITPKSSYLSYNNSLYETKDVGLNWNKISFIDTPLRYNTSINIEGNDSIAFWRDQNKLFISKNNGLTWTSAQKGLPNNLKIYFGPIISKNGPLLFTKNNIYQFTNRNWESKNLLNLNFFTIKNIVEVNGNYIIHFNQINNITQQDSDKLVISKNNFKSFEDFIFNLPEKIIITGIVPFKDSIFISTIDFGLFKIKAPDSVPDTILSVFSNAKIQSKYFLYPNPSNGEIFIRSESTLPITFELRSIEGKLIFKKENLLPYSEKLIDLPPIPQGVYLYTIIDPKRNTSNGKLIIYKH